MKRSLVATVVIVLGLLLIPLAASASPLRTFVREFTVSAPGSDQLKSTLKSLFASRLRGDGIEVVESEPEAEVVVSGSYTQLGKMFSLDAVARTSSGKQLAAGFEQGDDPDTVIAAVGKLAAKLKEQLAKGAAARESAATPPPAAAPPTPVAPAVAAPAATAIAPVAPAVPASRAIWSSPRLAGAQSALAPGGPDQFLTAQGQTIRLYRKDAKFTILAEAEVPSRKKIIGIDTLPSPEGGVLVFASLVDDEHASSRVYQAAAGGFKLLAEDLPYLFRVIAVNGGPRELYAQQLLDDGQFYGDVYQASFTQGSIKPGKALKMPHSVNLYTFNAFRGAAGESYLIAFTESGYLTVYSEAGKELWRSDDKFGGSENFIMGHDAENARFYSNPEKPRFIEQRITVTERGEVVVPQNTGLMVFGNMRSYSKYSMVALSWNGSALEELSRSKQGPGYLADYYLEPASGAAVVLEVTQKEGIFGKGASAIRAILPR